MSALPLCIALYADGLLCGTLDQLYPLFLVPHCSLQRALSLSRAKCIVDAVYSKVNLSLLMSFRERLVFEIGEKVGLEREGGFY